MHINANPSVQNVLHSVFASVLMAEKVSVSVLPSKSYSQIVCALYTPASLLGLQYLNDSPAFMYACGPCLLSMCATNSCTCYSTVGYGVDSCVHGMHGCTCVVCVRVCMRVHVCVHACLSGWVGGD